MQSSLQPAAPLLVGFNKLSENMILRRLMSCSCFGAVQGPTGTHMVPNQDIDAACITPSHLHSRTSTLLRVATHQLLQQLHLQRQQQQRPGHTQQLQGQAGMRGGPVWGPNPSPGSATKLTCPLSNAPARCAVQYMHPTTMKSWWQMLGSSTLGRAACFHSTAACPGVDSRMVLTPSPCH